MLDSAGLSWREGGRRQPPNRPCHRGQGRTKHLREADGFQIVSPWQYQGYSIHNRRLSHETKYLRAKNVPKNEPNRWRGSKCDLAVPTATATVAIKGVGRNFLLRSFLNSLFPFVDPLFTCGEATQVNKWPFSSWSKIFEIGGCEITVVNFPPTFYQIRCNVHESI